MHGAERSRDLCYDCTEEQQFQEREAKIQTLLDTIFPPMLLPYQNEENEIYHTWDYHETKREALLDLIRMFIR